MLLNKIKDNFVCLGFAEWVDGKGLQVPNTHSIDSELSGVYIMVDIDNNIQKVGKASASLKNRLSSYKSFDKSLDTAIKNGRRQDDSSLRQRRAIHENNFEGFYVYFLAAKVEKVNICGFETIRSEFDAHVMESNLKAMALEENHPLTFGNM